MKLFVGSIDPNDSKVHNVTHCYIIHTVCDCSSGYSQPAICPKCRVLDPFQVPSTAVWNDSRYMPVMPALLASSRMFTGAFGVHCLIFTVGVHPRCEVRVRTMMASCATSSPMPSVNTDKTPLLIIISTISRGFDFDLVMTVLRSHMKRRPSFLPITRVIGEIARQSSTLLNTRCKIHTSPILHRLIHYALCTLLTTDISSA
jgi:hypothetical protein